MSVEQNSLFCTLPVELIFHIFRHLDAQTIVRSFRLVCKRFRKKVNMYDEFDVIFKSVLKSDFYYLCNLILPKNITSLTLSDGDETPGQIEYFLSRFRIKQFTKLRSLTLLEIDDCHLSIVLKDVNKLELIELIIVSEEDFTQDNTILDDLSSAICLRTLQKLTLDISNIHMSQIVWPFECTIRHLEIHCPTFDAYRTILDHLPNLRILVVEELNTDNFDGTMPVVVNPPSFHQLSSLTFKYCNINMIILGFLLPLTPALEHLRLMRCVDIHDFIFHLSQWQNFIETRLLSLSRFEFLLIESSHFVTTPVYIEQLIAPFRTSFWTETKCWFVICDYTMNPRCLMLYSPSIYDPRFTYVFESKQISRATSTPTISNRVIMDGIRKLHLNLSQVMSLTTSAQGGLPSTPVFPKLDCLTLRVDHQWPTCSLRVLSTLINLSHLTEISLGIGNSFDYYPSPMANICSLLELAWNIQSLKISRAGFYTSLRERDMEIFPLIPTHVRHLTVTCSR